MDRIAVLMTCFNRKEKTLTCLDKVFKQEGLNEKFTLDVYLVDDGSTDGTGESVAVQFPLVNIIQGNGKLFWNRGMHLSWATAVKSGEYDFFLWLNDDTILGEDALNTLIETSCGYNHAAIVVGTTSAVDSKDITYGGKMKSTGLITPADKPKQCDYFNGNIVLIPKAVYVQVGMNDPVFHHALGDFDYGMRAKKKQIQAIVAPGILGTCDVHISLPTWCNPEKKFMQRWKAFRSPLGNNPEEFFVYEWRHNGLGMALFHYVTNHLRVICPQIWTKK